MQKSPFLFPKYCRFWVPPLDLTDSIFRKNKQTNSIQWKRAINFRGLKKPTEKKIINFDAKNDFRTKSNAGAIPG